MMNETQLRRCAMELGFADVGLCDASAFDAQRSLVMSQPALSERKQLRFVPQEDDEKIKSIAVLIWPYEQQRINGGRSVFIDSYYEASNKAYHAAIKLEERLLAEGCFAKANVSYPAKAAAVRAGIM